MASAIYHNIRQIVALQIVTLLRILPLSDAEACQNVIVKQSIIAIYHLSGRPIRTGKQANNIKGLTTVPLECSAWPILH